MDAIDTQLLDRIDALIPVMPAVLLLHWFAGSFK